jgi:peptidyl-prolyl cis-trans isomerase C
MDNKVLATVDGVQITQSQVDSFIKRLDPQQAMQYQNEEGKKHILQELINQTLFLADAKATKLEESDEFKNEISKMKDMILTQLNVNNLMASVKIDDTEVKAHFETNKTKFSTPEKTDTSHILVDSEEECKEVHNKITSNEITFEDAAKAHSKCPSKEKGGNLGSYPKGQMVSEPVKTQFGYHIIRLNEKQESAEAKFEEVKEQASKDLLGTKQKEEYMNKISHMRQTFKVEMA